ncbi:hypothetical protein BGZ65_009921 [Modicella reniformis]|uniref:Uncharacterized protein n=1 Tax=Modicella reniformis TaxID=1440133 RepID=A0A9P6SNY0_9FUNG|nr:hypothetical protein BGZ65_009921 [Modicella reniformis]
MAPSAVASAAFRDSVLFVHYSNGTDRFGTLYSVFPVLGSNSHGDGSSLAVIPQILSIPEVTAGLFVPENPNPPVRVSMISTTTESVGIPKLRHNLLLAINPSTSGKPSIVRLKPQGLSIGDGKRPVKDPQTPLHEHVVLETAAWLWEREELEGIALPANATRLSLASGISHSNLPTDHNEPNNMEGSSVFELFHDGTGYKLQYIRYYRLREDLVPWAEWVWTKDMNFLDSTVTPKVLRFMNDETHQGVVVGQCAGSASQTCLGFFNFDELQTFEQVPDGRWTYHDLDSPRPGEGTDSDKILACAAKDSTLFVITKGNNSLPGISTLNMDYSTNQGSSWTWKHKSLSSSYDIMVDRFAPEDKTGLASGALAGIIVGAVVVVVGVVGAGFVWRRKSRSRKQHGQEI